MDKRAELERLFHVAVAAADPIKVVPAHIPDGPLVIIGAGKASARMAEAVEAARGPCPGLVITRYGHARDLRGPRVVQAAHPVPDDAGVAATGQMLAMLADLPADAHVLALISGGGSALLCAPVVPLAEKMAITKALLASGASISEINCVRKHLSRVKGGQLAAATRARMTTLLISDVPGDDPADIASGPTVGEASTQQDAAAICARWNVPLPTAWGAPVPPGDPRLDRCTTRVIAAPAASLAAAADAAVWDTRVLGDALEGEARDLGAAHARMALDLQAELTQPLVLLSGGECTVTRRGDGCGGPNAEYVLSALLTLNGAPGVHVLSCDTDGVDGAAEIAGAYAGPDTGLDGAAQALATNDAHGFFGRCGGQIITGPTLTNVNDFRAILIEPHAP